jgi:uncharacterized repeat protein (TIGR01451 family)
MKSTHSLLLIAALGLVVGGACVAPPPAAAAPLPIGGCAILPPDNVWNTSIDTLPVDSNSTAYINSINLDATTLHPDFGSSKYGNYGIPYNIVSQDLAKVAVTFRYASESDRVLYPIPKLADLKIEGGLGSDGDRHILMVEQGTCKLYETWASYPNDNGTWRAGSGAVFDLTSNQLRTDGWTSADAAGLPILPGLARYEEVAAGAINHALRFTVYCTADAYIWPARHQAVPDACPAVQPAGALPPPMGQRFRLKKEFDITRFSPQTRVILAALKKYGMIVADNGSSWYISGTPDEGWDDDALVGDLRQIHGSDFEAIDESALQVGPDSGQVKPSAVDSKSVTPSGASQGQQVAYTIQIVGDGSPVALSDPLPAALAFVNNSLTTSGGGQQASYNTGTITWSGTPAPLTIVTIAYAATLNTSAIQPVSNIASVTRSGATKQLTAVVIANPKQMFLPVARR